MHPIPPPGPRRRRRRHPRLAAALLLLPVLGLSIVPFYDREEPRLMEVPFFYWYQLAWVPLSVMCMAAAALLIPLPDREGIS